MLRAVGVVRRVGVGVASMPPPRGSTWLSSCGTRVMGVRGGVRPAPVAEELEAVVVGLVLVVVERHEHVHVERLHQSSGGGACHGARAEGAWLQRSCAV